MKEFLLSQDELQEIFVFLPAEGIVFLEGDLASGKTAFVQEWLKSLGFKQEVCSPTFSIMQKYSFLSYEIYHYDIYQEGKEGLLRNGLFENFFEKGLHLVEWGNQDLKLSLERYGLKVTTIKIEIYQDKRKYKIYE